MNKLVVAALLCGLLPHNSVIAQIVKGQLKNTAGNALSQALVKVRGTEIQTLSNQLGEFELDLPEGDYTIDVEGGRGEHFHQVIQVTASSQPIILVSMQDEPEHKIVVRMNPLEHTALDMATPTIILSGDELTLKRAGTLGDILKFEPGISMSSFGPSVARPVIRGLSGSRVKITNNQMMVQDASTTSADHDTGVEPLLADQIEVVKGPATLIYGSGAIGGVVNVTDRKIFPDRLEELSGGIELRLADNSTGETTLVFGLDNGNAEWNWHIDGYSSKQDDIKIPDGAESKILHESEDHEEPNEAEIAERYLANSHAETQGGSLGTTYMQDWGYLGLAVSRINKDYAVPGHAHHDEAVEGVASLVEEHEESVYIDMQQTRYDLQAQIDQPFSLFENWFVGYAYTDYQHAELEGNNAEGFAIGTQFENKAMELKSYLKHHEWAGWSGVWGLQISQRDFVALGEEAFVPPSKTENLALFVVEEKNFGALKWELGSRVERQQINADERNEVADTALSVSLGGVYTLSEHNKLAANVSRAVRFASVEELYSDGAHIATRSYEIGNAGLLSEKSNNLDLSYRFEVANINGEINLYSNQFSDFIYAANAEENDSCVSAEALSHAQQDELLIVCYRQQDADFKGAEFQLGWVINPDSLHQFSLGVVADYIQAKLDSGEYIPRIPPTKYGINVGYDFAEFSAQLSWMAFNTQNKVSENELRTEGFEMLDLDLAYRLPIDQAELFLFAKGKNLLNEDARDHASFLKDLAPQAGRGLLVGARYSF